MSLFDAIAHLRAAHAELLVWESGCVLPLAQTARACAQQTADIIETIESLGAPLGRRAVLCSTCDGAGWTHDGIPHSCCDESCIHRCSRDHGALIEPCEECIPCPDCGRDGCGPGVRWEDPRCERPKQNRPTIVCLCGSTRFGAAFDATNYRETLAGNIVLSIGCVTTSDVNLGVTDAQKAALDELHKRKIDLADEVLVLDVDGYIGESTRSEIEYARQHGKRLRFLSDDPEPASSSSTTSPEAGP